MLKSLLKAWTKIVAVLSISSSWELDFIAFKKTYHIARTILPLVGAVISCKGINICWIWCRSTVSRPWFGVANSERCILCILTMTADCKGMILYCLRRAITGSWTTCSNFSFSTMTGSCNWHVRHLTNNTVFGFVTLRCFA